MYTLALTYLAFFNLMVDFSLNAYFVPKLMGPDFANQWRRLLGIRVIWAVILSIAASLIILLWPDQDPLFRITVLIGTLALFGNSIYISAVAFFQSRLRYDLSSIAFAIAPLVTLIGIFIALKLNIGAPGLMAAQVIGATVLGACALLFLKRFLTPLPIFDFSHAKEVFLVSWPLSATLVINMVYFRLDAFILKYFRNFSEVGIYNVSYQIFQTLLVVPAYIMNSFYPLMLEDFSVNRTRFIRNLKRALLGMIIVSILATVSIFLLAPLMINILTGSQGFEGSVNSLQILSFSFPAFFITSVLMWTLVVLKRYKTMLVIYLIGFIFNSVANLIFIPQYSYLAASWITVASEYLILTLQVAILIPTFKK